MGDPAARARADPAGASGRRSTGSRGPAAAATRSLRWMRVGARRRAPVPARARARRSRSRLIGLIDSAPPGPVAGGRGPAARRRRGAALLGAAGDRARLFFALRPLIIARRAAAARRARRSGSAGAAGAARAARDVRRGARDLARRTRSRRADDPRAASVDVGRRPRGPRSGRVVAVALLLIGLGAAAAARPLLRARARARADRGGLERPAARRRRSGHGA